ncbi:MAG: hypothetical protein E7619_08985 [Ruminococcaceae bacterium]|nr:hypothetical protein [Oscillospiraceae bacterium]
MILDRYSPPGYNHQREKNIFVALLLLSCFISLGFIAEYVHEINSLYYYDGGRRLLKEGAVVKNFAGICRGYMYCFSVAAITVLCFSAIRYMYLFGESKSIYTAKRLPKKLPVFSIIAPIPATYAVLLIAVKCALLCIYAIIYVNFTPEQCLPVNMWQGIWRL